MTTSFSQLATKMTLALGASADLNQSSGLEPATDEARLSAAVGERSGWSGGRNGGVHSDGGVYVGGCPGLQCQQTTCTQGVCKQHVCANGAKTTVSGTVYDPAGKTRRYNIIVYVPNAPVAPTAEGVTCDKCDGTATGFPISSALTDPAGHFLLDNASVGTPFPLVIPGGARRLCEHGWNAGHLTAGYRGAARLCDHGRSVASEKAHEFMLFDLSPCVQSEEAAPVPPVVH